MATPTGGSAESTPLRQGGVFFRRRNAAGTLVAIVLLTCPWGRSELHLWQFVAGGVLVLTGAALRIWCVLQIGGAAHKTSNFKAVRLVSWGPFSFARNPIYVANISVFAGFAFLSGLLWALPIIVGGLWWWYDALIGQEEDFLAGKFPEEFGAYQAAVRRWWPGLRYRQRPPEVPSYPLLRAFRRERAHLLIVTIGPALVVGIRLAIAYWMAEP